MEFVCTKCVKSDNQICACKIIELNDNLLAIGKNALICEICRDSLLDVKNLDDTNRYHDYCLKRLIKETEIYECMDLACSDKLDQISPKNKIKYARIILSRMKINYPKVREIIQETPEFDQPTGEIIEYLLAETEDTELNGVDPQEVERIYNHAFTSAETKQFHRIPDYIKVKYAIELVAISDGCYNFTN
jgi:hypothetical protein